MLSSVSTPSLTAELVGMPPSLFLVGPNVAYIRANEHQVHCTPVLPLDGLNQAQRDKLCSMAFTLTDWESIFGSIQSGHLPVWLVELENIQSEEEAVPDDLQLLTPMASRDKHGVFDIVPSFSFESTGEEQFEEKEGISDDVDARLLKVEGRLISLKSKITRPFLDIDASYSALSADVHKLFDKIKLLTIAVGPIQRMDSVNASLKAVSSKVALLEEFKSDILTRFNRLSSNVEEIRDNVNGFMEDFTEQQSVTSQLSTWMSNTDKILTTSGKRFATIKPLLQKMHGHAHTTQEDHTLQDHHASYSTASRDIQVGDAEAMARRIADLEDKIKLLENRVVGAGVQMGSFVFQSFEDLVRWVQVKVPKGRFGLFVDGHSFLEFFTLSGHVDTEVGTAAVSHSIKAGFSTYVEAQLAMSFKNLFPAVFGKGGSSSMDDLDCLPAITKGDKWNNGST